MITPADVLKMRIQMLECEILEKYNSVHEDYTHFSCLLEMRKEMINQVVLARQEELLPDIISFNDALTDALREMYICAHRIWDHMAGQEPFGDQVSLIGMCFLGEHYPSLHPIQGEDREDLWTALCDTGWNKLYDWGCTLQSLSFPDSINVSFDAFIGLDCPPPNWNEGLDRELTKDLHLTSAFHHLFDHTMFAITDFIYVRDFETDIKLEFSKRIG